MSDREDYTPKDVEAARTLLIELAELFKDLGDDWVLVGGWVPALLIGEAAEQHVGSLDVDLAFRLTTKQIDERLQNAGFWPHPRDAFRYLKDVGDISVAVDILVPETTVRPKRKGPLRTELRPFAAPGCELALSASTRVALTSGVDIRVAAVVPFLVMKAKALAGRAPKKVKDAYDIDYVLKHFPGGVEAIARDFGLFREEPVTAEAIAILRTNFETVDSRGCRDVADFLADDDRELVKRDAYERMQRLLLLLVQG